MRVLAVINPNTQTREILSYYAHTLQHTERIETNICDCLYERNIVQKTHIRETTSIMMGWVYEKRGETIEYGAQQFHHQMQFVSERETHEYLSSYRGAVSSIMISNKEVKLWVGSRDGSIDFPLYSYFGNDDNLIISDSQELLLDMKYSLGIKEKITYLKTNTLITITKNSDQITLKTVEIKR